MFSVFRAISVLLVGLTFAFQANATTLQLDFDFDFSDPLDLDSAPPDGAGPWMTASFDDGGGVGSVTLTIDLFVNQVTGIYLNVDDAIGVGNLTFTDVDVSAVGSSNILTGTDSFRPDSDGLYDFFIDLPPPPGSAAARFSAGEQLVYNITGTGLTASSFNFLSTHDELSLKGPFLGAAKFASTGDGDQSAWVAVVPVPAAVWLFGSALLGLGGLVRRKKVTA